MAGTADVLPIPDGSVETAVSGLVLNFVPEPAVMLTEMRRITAAGGVVAAYVWDYADGMALLRRFWDAAVALDPSAAAQDEGRRFPVCAPDPLAAAARSAGLVNVEVTALEIDTAFTDFDEYWRPFLAATGPAPSYVASLAEDGRTALRDRLRASLPIAADGSIALSARAWAVRGTA
jgi:SAM-dependent methyltransferase